MSIPVLSGQGLPANAWVIFPEDGKISNVSQQQNLTARPVNFSQSVASKLLSRQSFVKINSAIDGTSSSTPVELFGSQVALLEDSKDEKIAPNSRRKAIFAGASVGGGALLLGALLIGGTLLATNTGDNIYKPT